ncbi:MAG TPA: copper homeostasis protein CutC [Gemmatimonadales bacterium]
MESILLELACGSLDDALAAVRARADRIELCSALELEGLTPSLGTALEVDRFTSVPFVAMVRPRAGDFVYSLAELRVMDRDARLLAEAGASGIVFGCLTHEGRVDEASCDRVLSACNGCETVFHRAFDQVKDQLEALDVLIGLGVTRVLTSGGAKTALEGVKKIRALIERAEGRIEILPAGGIRDHNVESVIKQTGCDSVHLSRR